MAIVLTAKDFSFLEQMLLAGGGSDQAHGLIRRKLDEAKIVFGSDIDPEVVTLNSRVRYRINANPPEERTLVAEPGHEVRGMTIQLGTLRGVAMLGMAAGEAVMVPRRDGTVETLVVEAGLFQPEAERNPDPIAEIIADAMPQRSSTSAVTLLSEYRLRRRTPATNGDDPGPQGPSAA